MQVKHGELLPRVEALVNARAIESYVAESALVNTYQSQGPAFSLYTILSFAIGCGLSIVLFMLNNSVYSSSAELAMLRSLPRSTIGEITVSIVQPKPSPQRLPENPRTIKPTSQHSSLPAVFKPLASPLQQERFMDIRISQIEPKRAGRLVKRAINLASTQGYKSAEKTLLREYQGGNASQKLLSALGALYSKHRKWKKAALSYSRACHNYTVNAECFYNLAVTHDHLKAHSKAIAYYKKALEYGGGSSGFIQSEVELRIRQLKKW